MEQQDIGILLNGSDIKLHRHWFVEMCSLIGIKAIYRAPLPNKHYTTYTEIESNYQKPEVVGCIYQEHVDQKTMRKLGWVAELDETATIISIPYDLHDVQVGALFIIPSGIDNAQGRLFRVSQLSNIPLYPASITCQLVPEYEDTYSATQSEFKHSSFNLLAEEDE